MLGRDVRKCISDVADVAGMIHAWSWEAWPQHTCSCGVMYNPPKPFHARISLADTCSYVGLIDSSDMNRRLGTYHRHSSLRASTCLQFSGLLLLA